MAAICFDGIITAGNTMSKDYTIPSDETWKFVSGYVSANVSGVIVKLLVSFDGGTTWVNPLERDNTISSGETDNCFFKCFTNVGHCSFTFGDPSTTKGLSDALIRIEITNNTETDAEIKAVFFYVH